MAVSTYFANAIMNWLRGTAFPSAPTAVYVALFNADPLGGSATEQTTLIRAAGRVAAGFGAPSGGFIANAAKIDFGAAAGNASVNYSALMDAPTGGNILMTQALNPRTIYQNDPVYYDIGQLQFQVSSPS